MSAFFDVSKTDQRFISEAIVSGLEADDFPINRFLKDDEIKGVKEMDDGSRMESESEERGGKEGVRSRMRGRSRSTSRAIPKIE